MAGKGQKSYIAIDLKSFYASVECKERELDPMTTNLVVADKSRTEVNGLLEEKGLNFKVHLRDACGKQSCWIEPLGNCACEGRYEEMYQVVEEYFRRKGQKIEFDETKLNFFAV